MLTKIFTTTLCVLFALFANFRSYAQDFPGRDPSLLLNKEVKVKPKAEVLQKYGFEDFYKDENLKKKFACCESYNSKYASLAEKVFKVTDVKPYKDIINREKFIIKLSSSETGEVYYEYDPQFEFKFPFEVIGGLSFPEGFYCKDIEKKYDKFKGDTTYTTPSSEGIMFIKVKKDNRSDIYLRTQVSGATANVGQKGLIFLLENNKRIEKPAADIDVKVSSTGGSYIYSAFEELSEDDIKLLTENAITDERLYIHDGTIKNGKRIIDYLKCLVSM